MLEEKSYKELNKIIIKHQLITYQLDEINNLYYDKYLYKVFLQASRELLLESSILFFLNSTVSDNLLSYINSRKDLENYQDLRVDINTVIDCYSRIRNFPEKMLRSSIQKDFHLRFGNDYYYKLLFSLYSIDSEEVSRFITELNEYDYLYYLYVRDGKVSLSLESEDYLLISSTNFLIDKIPGFFNSIIKQYVMEILNKAESEENKQFVKYTKKNLLNLW